MWKSGQIYDQCVPGSPPPAHREPGDEARGDTAVRNASPVHKIILLCLCNNYDPHTPL